MNENVKEVLNEMLEILKQEMASHHRYTECGGDYSEECRNSNCSYAYKCSASKDLENRLNKLQEKINK